MAENNAGTWGVEGHNRRSIQQLRRVRNLNTRRRVGSTIASVSPGLKLHVQKTVQLLTMIILALPAWTDSLAVKDGKIYRGTFLGASSHHIIVKVDGRVKRSFAVSEIDSRHFARSEEAKPSTIDQKCNALSQTLGMPTDEKQVTSDARGLYRIFSKWRYLLHATNWCARRSGRDW